MSDAEKGFALATAIFLFLLWKKAKRDGVTLRDEFNSLVSGVSGECSGTASSSSGFSDMANGNGTLPGGPPTGPAFSGTSSCQ